MTRSRTAVLAVVLASLPLLAGCHAGLRTDVFSQGTTGNGADVFVEGAQVADAVLVAGDPGSGEAAFLGTVINLGELPDQLLTITVDGIPMELAPEPIELPPGQGVPIQVGRDAEALVTELDAPAGTYVGVEMLFRNAAIASFETLVVPPAGYYAPAAPKGTVPVPAKVNTSEEPLPGHE